MRFKLEKKLTPGPRAEFGGGQVTIRETIEVPDAPVASDLDAMQRRHSLDSLELHRRCLAGQLGPASPNQRQKISRELARMDKALEQLRGQLAVWDTHEQ